MIGKGKGSEHRLVVNMAERGGKVVTPILRQRCRVPPHRRPHVALSGETYPRQISLYCICDVRLKLAFCMTCAIRVLVLAQGPSFGDSGGPC